LKECVCVCRGGLESKCKVRGKDHAQPMYNIKKYAPVKGVKYI